MSEHITFKMDDKALRQWAAALEQFPKEARRQMARMLNDMAFAYKNLATPIINKHMTVRKKSFVSSSFRVQKANPHDSPSRMQALAGSIARDRFSGWAEQEGGAPTGNRHTRAFKKKARGGSMGKMPKQKARLHQGDIIDAADLSGPTVPTEGSRNQLAIWLAAQKEGKGGRVILRGSGTGKGGGRTGPNRDKEFSSGLYTISHIKPEAASRFIRVDQLQEFDTEIVTKRIPWNEEIAAAVRKEFTPEHILNHYIARALLEAAKKTNVTNVQITENGMTIT